MEASPYCAFLLIADVRFWSVMIHLSEWLIMLTIILINCSYSFFSLSSVSRAR